MGNSRYSTIELIDIIKNDTNKDRIRKAQIEFDSRNFSLAQKEEIEAEYRKYILYKNRRKSQSLTRAEWWSFFILPMVTPGPLHRDDHFSDSELERFNKYGFEKKIRQAQTVQLLGILFWIILFLILGIIYKLYIKS